jgi:hypothetical protein
LRGDGEMSKSRSVQDAFEAMHNRVIVLVDAQEIDDLVSDFSDEFEPQTIKDAWERMLDAVYSIRFERQRPRKRGV